MLVLSRGPEESIIIKTSDGEIEVKYLEQYQSGKIKIGIAAPRSVNIVRKELVQRDDDFGNR